MSSTITLNGTTHVIPTRNETNWGSNVTDYLEDIAEVLDGTFQSVTGNGATSIDFSSGRNVNLNLTASATLTLSNPRTGRPSVLWITQNNTGYTITWPAAVKWQGGTAPDLSGGTGLYIVTLLYNSGSAIYAGEFSANAYS